MKTKITIALMFLVSAGFYVSISGLNYEKSKVLKESVLNSTSNSQTDSFILGAFQSGWDKNYTYTGDSLGLNLWHIYIGDDTDNTGRHFPVGWVNHNAAGDTLFADSTAYVNQVRNVLSGVNNHDMKSLMMRPKILWLCYGQRSDYQCEPVSSGDDLWFYSFNEHETGITVTDSGNQVIHCRTIPSNSTSDNAGYVVKRLMANTEQSNPYSGYQGDKKCDWFIKPRIRIDSNVVDIAPNTLVCKIIVIGQSGTDTMKSLKVISEMLIIIIQVNIKKNLN